ncbi:cilia- and flagella-associated protein 61 [Orussus abietinus]|uniref:cilia- and flagella-associated protein 61 n=1 Tax=Orussus abietinus TaxID=222816 RepID=UPI000C716346|nr:cilia- and flagella-associated protein 61 [Orussus abietinus]
MTKRRDLNLVPKGGNAISILGFRGSTRRHPLVCCLNVMVPVMPRNPIRFNFEQNPISHPESSDLKCPEKFSLFMLTAQLASIRTLTVNTRIVIVGASNCGLALMEYLVSRLPSNHTHFSNVTLISTNGLPYVKKRSSLIYSMIPFKGRYCRGYWGTVPGRVWVTVVNGTVTAINRKERNVIITTEGKLSYDYLILTCGLQYQPPKYPLEINGKGQRGEMSKYAGPVNCLTINDDQEASECLATLTKSINHHSSVPIVIYGHNLDCYCALEALLKFGVKGSWITLVRPPSPPCQSLDAIFFNDTEVYNAVIQALIENEVIIIPDGKVTDWILEEIGDHKYIKKLKIESECSIQMISCDFFLYFHEKEISINTFMAISRAGLVFDGELVIDLEYRTNDPFIFAAGTMTKYSRKYCADSWQHKYFNSMEIGERLAKLLRNTMDPCNSIGTAVVKKPNIERKLQLPVFREPLTICCTLPGKYNYLHIRKPGKKVPSDVAINYENYGNVLISGKCDMQSEYFRLRLNQCDMVETVTCVSNKNFEVLNMMVLYGAHDSMLNDVKLRFRSSMLPINTQGKIPHDLLMLRKTRWATGDRLKLISGPLFSFLFCSMDIPPVSNLRDIGGKGQ